MREKVDPVNINAMGTYFTLELFTVEFVRGFTPEYQRVIEAQIIQERFLLLRKVLNSLNNNFVGQMVVMISYITILSFGFTNN